MIISIEAEKALEKFMIRTLGKLEKEENYLKLTRNVYKNPIANTIPHDGRLHAFSLKSRKGQGYQPSSFLFNKVQEDIAPAIRQVKEIKDIQMGREEIKSFLIADAITVYVEIQRNLQ